MKKILGSPIGLGEVNLTVDNRVRRNIKEYFGNVTKPEDVTKWALYVNVDEKKYKNSPEDALSKESQFSVTGMYLKKNEYDALDLVGRYFKVESLSETLYIKIESNPTDGSNQFRSKTMLVNKDVIKEIEEKTTKLIKATEEDPSLLFVKLIPKEDEDKIANPSLDEYFKSEDEKLNTFRGIGFPFDAIITLAESNDSKKKLKIGVTAPERFLRKIFRIIINGVKIYFLPITKVGNKLEGDPVVIADNDWGKIKDSLTSQNTQAYLPANAEEKQEFDDWLDEQQTKFDEELAAAGKAIRDDTGKEVSEETDKTSKPECEAQDCKKYIKDGLDGYCVTDYKDEQKNEKGELITGCVESDPSGCCISKSCKEKKGIWQTNDKKNLILVLSIFFGVTSILLFVAVICSYYYYKKTGTGNYESITTTFPYSDYLKKSFVLGGICCLLLIPWALFEAKIVSLTVSCPEEDDSCPEDLEERSLVYRGAGCPKCGPKCSTDERYCKKKCSCVPKCKVGETFCKKKCSCITAGMTCTSY